MLNPYFEIGIPGSCNHWLFIKGRNRLHETLGVKKVSESDLLIPNIYSRWDLTVKVHLCSHCSTRWWRKNGGTIYHLSNSAMNLILSDPIATEQCTIRDLLSIGGMYENTVDNEHVIDFQYSNFPEILFRVEGISHQRVNSGPNLLTITSCFHWQGNLQQGLQEWTGGIIKTKIIRSSRYDLHWYPSLMTISFNPNYAATHYTVDGITYYVPSTVWWCLNIIGIGRL